MIRHGDSRRGKVTKEYTAWVHMLGRCYNPNTKDWPDYGGRGITVCPEWRLDYCAFILDMGRCPAGKSLDREDVNGNYEPSNCRWATAREQGLNKRSSGLCKNGHPLNFLNGHK